MKRANYNSSISLTNHMSQYDKDCNSTQGFEYQQAIGDSSFDFVQSLDEFDLEQSCLLRLKAQRQKIEELTKIYQENEKELLRRSLREKEMQEEIERLNDMSTYKQEWCDLKNDWDCLCKKNALTESELTELHRKLESLTFQYEEEIEVLKQQVKYQKEQRCLSDSHWEAIINDKEQQIRKQARCGQQNEYSLNQKIQKLQQEINMLKECLSEKGTQFQCSQDDMQKELRTMQEDLCNFEKVVESLKKQNGQYKHKLVDMQDVFEKERCEYLEVIEQLKMQVKLLRKDQAEKENELYEFKQIVKKCDSKNQALQSTCTSLKANLKKFKVNTDTSLKKMTCNSEQEKQRLQLFIAQLKCQLERQMDQKAQLAGQVKRLRGQIQRKEQQEKQRKLLLMSEFREIDKMEKVVKKIF